MEKDIKIKDLTQEEKDEIVNKIDKQIKINELKEKLYTELDKEFIRKDKLEEAVKKIDDKMLENALNEKGPIFAGGIRYLYQPEYKWYEATKEIDGEEINIHSYDLNNIGNVLNLASDYFKNLDISRLKEIISNEYYESDKDGELQGITKEQFINNLSLLSISVDNNYVEYWFDDNDMYGGHNIVVSKKHDSEKYTIDLAG